MSEFWQIALTIYAVSTVFVVLGAGIAWCNGDLRGHPLAFVFWPIIALNAAIIHIWRMWRE